MLVRALAVMALVCVLVPTCSMAVGAMNMDLAGLASCEDMWFTSDAEAGIPVAALAFTLFLVAAMPTVARLATHATPIFVVGSPLGPRPPDDPLVGRLII